MPQPGQATGRAALDGADADVERGRGVGLGQVLQVAQDDDCALPLRQRPQCGENRAVGERVRDRRHGGGDVVRVEQHLGTATQRPPPVDVRAHYAAIGVAERIGLDRVPSPRDGRQRLLDEILGVLPIAAQAVGGVQQPIAVLGDESLEHGPVRLCHGCLFPSVPLSDDGGPPTGCLAHERAGCDDITVETVRHAVTNRRTITIDFVQAARRGKKSDGKGDLLAKIAEMAEPDRVVAERLHALIKASAPAFSP